MEEGVATKRAPKKARKSVAPARRSEAEAARPKTQPVTHEEIARRAYGIYISRGGGEGGAHEDWLRAERELQS